VQTIFNMSGDNCPSVSFGNKNTKLDVFDASCACEIAAKICARPAVNIDT